jgi:hypothetical protein
MESDWKVDWSSADGEFRLTISDPADGRTWAASGPDLFDAFAEIRRHLERVGIRICVNGARVDAYPSGSSREMSGGQMVYLLPKLSLFGKMVRLAGLRRNELVYIFSPAPCHLVGSVDEQDAYFERWMNDDL